MPGPQVAAPPRRRPKAAARFVRDSAEDRSADRLRQSPDARRSAAAAAANQVLVEDRLMRSSSLARTASSPLAAPPILRGECIIRCHLSIHSLQRRNVPADARAARPRSADCTASCIASLAVDGRHRRSALEDVEGGLPARDQDRRPRNRGRRALAAVRRSARSRAARRRRIVRVRARALRRGSRPRPGARAGRRRGLARGRSGRRRGVRARFPARPARPPGRSRFQCTSNRSVGSAAVEAARARRTRSAGTRTRAPAAARGSGARSGTRSGS